MPRPTKLRTIGHIPDSKYFVPLGVPKCNLSEIELKLEELEAMRLKDIEGLSQEECAECMKVSRQTFQLIIDEARKKVAIALTQGKAINIQGGNYTLNICTFRCKNCGEVFEQPYEKDKKICPNCKQDEVECVKSGSFCTGHCRRRFFEDRE